MSQITRRRLLQGSGAVAAGLALEACTGTASNVGSGPTGAPGSGKRPNILMIVSDDIGYSDLGCFGGEIPTPNLDRLAQGGRRFTQLLTNPMCCPSRAALLTGLYPTQAGVGYYTNDEGTPGYQGHLNANCATLAEVLGAAGYATAISGKWHVSNWRTPSAEPPQRGFDQSFCEIGGNGFFTTERFLNGRKIGVSPNPDFYMTDAITSFAKRQIQTMAHGGKPFFLYTAYTSPHFPLQAPADDIAKFHGKYEGGWDVLRQSRYQQMRSTGIIDPAWALSPLSPGVNAWDASVAHNWQASRMEVYAAMVSVMDQGVGVLLDTLEQEGVLDDTLVLFFGDNGASAEEIPLNSRHGLPTRNGKPMRSGNSPTIFPGASDTFCSYGRPWGSASATPFRRYKLWVEEGGICTPFIASWPGVLPGGGIDHRTLHLMDFMPTVVDIAGARYPSTRQGQPVHPMQGQSFADVLQGDVSAPASTDRWLFWEFQGHRAARHGNWKIVDDESTGPWELYDMASDRTELHDLASAHPDVVQQMSAAWSAWKARVGVRTWSPTREYRPT